MPVATSRGEVAQDEGINGAITLEELAAKRPAFRKGGTVTGGNSSPLNDGAAALLLMSDDAVRRAGVRPLARYAGAAAAGVHPDYMGIGPVPAMNRVLGRRWRLDELDLIEVNEAFAAQSVAVVDELKADPDRVQRQRRRDRHRASARLLRRADRDHAAARDAPSRRRPRRGQHVHRRGPGHRLPVGSRLTARSG